MSLTTNQTERKSNMNKKEHFTTHVPCVTITPREWEEPPEGTGVCDFQKPVAESENECSGLTRGELCLLGAHWYESFLNSEFFITIYQCVGRSDLWSLGVAERRVDRIGELLGEKRMSEIVDEVDAAFAEQVGDEGWYYYRHASEKERNEYSEWLHKRMTHSAQPSEIKAKTSKHDMEPQANGELSPKMEGERSTVGE